MRRRQWHPTPVLLPGKSHGWRSLVGCSPCGRWGSDTTERLHFHFSLSCIGEGNGNPPQCSCLENPRDGGAWRAAVYGVAQSRTQLKWLSSSSSNNKWCWASFHVPTGHLHVFFGEMSAKVFCPFFNWVVWFFGWVGWAVRIFWRVSPCLSYHLQIFSLIPSVSLAFFFLIVGKHF